MESVVSSEQIPSGTRKRFGGGFDRRLMEEGRGIALLLRFWLEMTDEDGEPTFVFVGHDIVDEDEEQQQTLH
jgi:hypothetical protein